MEYPRRTDVVGPSTSSYTLGWIDCLPTVFSLILFGDMVVDEFEIKLVIPNDSFPLSISLMQAKSSTLSFPVHGFTCLLPKAPRQRH